MFVRGTVKKSTANAILLIKFKRIIAMKEKFAQFMEAINGRWFLEE